MADWVPRKTLERQFKIKFGILKEIYVLKWNQPATILQDFEKRGNTNGTHALALSWANLAAAKLHL